MEKKDEDISVGNNDGRLVFGFIDCYVRILSLNTIETLSGPLCPPFPYTLQSVGMH